MSEANDNGVAAFFDLDRTLIDVNSGLLYAQFERRHKRIGRLQMAQSLFWLVLYHLSAIDMERVYAKAVSHYRGLSDAMLAERTHHWFREEVEGRLQPGARATLEAHRAQGHPVVVLTNSSCYAAREATSAWDLDGWLANIFPVDEGGLLTGEFESPLCYGQGKVTRAESWARDRGVSLSDSYFYTDSLSDRPMLEAVGHPRVVNPDPRLRRLAKRQGWPIYDWQSAESAL